MHQPGIQDYAIVGDGRSAALISKEGSVDWLCWPRFDSPAFFSSLLDQQRGGRFSIHPVEAHATSRRYLPHTNVLETRFTTGGGQVAITDFMPVASEEEKGRELFPDHELVRLVVCEEGTVELGLEVAVRPGYGLRSSEMRRLHPVLGVTWKVGRGTVRLRSDALERLHPREGSLAGTLTLREGEAVVFSLTYSQEAPATLPPLDGVRAALARTVAWWRGWIGQMTYRGPYREQVARSALTLKLLIYAPSGAVIAAPTTSLPEEPGGAKNWDYRYCWLRDASFTVRALFGLGYHKEAEAFLSWLLHTTRLTHPRLQVLYNVYGETSGREKELPLAGYRGARPVRVGNAAEGQLQLDIYGEVMDAAAQYIHQGGSFDSDTRDLLVGMGRYVCENWDRPDEGIWEVRTGRRDHTHSRVLCWTALDRLVELASKGFLSGAPTETFARVRDEIRRDVELHGWSDPCSSYVSVYGTDHIDSVLLLLPWYGYTLADTPRMEGTHRRIVAELSAGGGLLFRYREMGGAREGAFGLCSFWAVDFLARGGGSLRDARALFEVLGCYTNDVGLYAEEIDPRSHDPLGNFPQGFSHVGLINAALAIQSGARGERVPPHHNLRRKR
jgi:GH15 family glucan-1,4-alpha-glucosidase